MNWKLIKKFLNHIDHVETSIHLHGSLLHRKSQMLELRPTTKVNTDYVVSSRWRLTWKLFLVKVLTIVLDRFLIKTRTPPLTVICRPLVSIGSSSVAMPARIHNAVYRDTAAWTFCCNSTCMQHHTRASFITVLCLHCWLFSFYGGSVALLVARRTNNQPTIGRLRDRGQLK